MEDEVVRELKEQGAYFLTEEQANQLSKFVMRANGNYESTNSWKNSSRHS